MPSLSKFTGKERDSESGLDNFGARYDASSLGRFMTPDWAAKPTTVPYASFGDPQTLNLYAYVRNNPVSRADADGHCADHYKDGTCKVNVDSATGQAGAKAGKQLEGVLNKYVGTFQNQCMHSDSCRAAQFQYVKNHPVASTLTPVAVIGASVTMGMFGPELGAAALVRFAPLLTAAGSGLQTARDEATSAIQSLKSFDLSNVTSSRVSGALNSLSDHVTDMDIKGAVREANGLLEGNHATGELKDAVNSLSNLKDSLQGALQNPNLSDNTRAGFTQAVQAINNFVQSEQPVIDQARKQQAAQ